MPTYIYDCPTCEEYFKRESAAERAGRLRQVTVGG